MKLPDQIETKARDLLFEITGHRQAKFLLAVCDSAPVRRSIRHYIEDELHRHKEFLTTLSAKQITGNLLDCFLEMRRSEGSLCIMVWGIPTMKDDAVDRIFFQLNFHRDALTSLSIPILLWLSTVQLRRLATIAPDFWSRRTAVYQFSGSSPKELLRKLFGGSTDTEQRQNRGSDIAVAISEVLVAEKNLRHCLKDREVFSVENADNCIGRLERSLSFLADQCRNGRRLEIALALWAISRVDKDIQTFMDSLEPEAQNMFDYVNTDRNEAVLYSAEKMEDVLREYAQQIQESVRTRKRASLIALFRRTAEGKLNAILSDLAAQREISFDQLPLLSVGEDEELDYAEYLIEEEPFVDLTYDGQQGSFTAPEAVYDLESWLAGYSNHMPAAFSEEEGAILKFMYRESSDPADVASMFRLTRPQATRKIRSLEKKVQQYLASLEQRPQPNLSPSRSS